MSRVPNDPGRAAGEEAEVISSDIETIAFRMLLRPGAEKEYRRRHDEIWPDLVAELRAAGIYDYRIFRDPENHCLFAVITRVRKHGMDDLPDKPVVRRWWAMMADLMATEPDLSPKVTALEEVFRLAAPASRPPHTFKVRDL
jgi:L-rhamnose mutarotase